MKGQIGHIDTSKNDLVNVPREICDKVNDLGERIPGPRFLEEEIVGGMGHYCTGNNP